MAQPHDEQEQNPQEWGQPQAARSLPQIVWQRKSLVALGAIVGLALGALVYAQRTPIYQSSSQVMVLKKNANPMPMTGPDARMAYFEDYVASHLVLIKSPLIIEGAVKRRDLRSLKSFEGIAEPAGIIVGSLNVARDTTTTGGSGMSNILNLSYRGTVAEDCGKILNAVLESYQEFLDIQYRNVSDQTLELITKARDNLKKDLALAKGLYRNFRRTSPLILRSNKDGSAVHHEHLATVATERTTVLVQEAKLRKRVEALEQAIKEGRGREALAALADTAGARAKAAERSVEEQLLPLLLQEEQLLEDYGEDHPQVKSVRRRIALTRDIMRRGIVARERSVGEGSGLVDPVERHLLTLRQELHETEFVRQSLTQLLESLKNDARELSNYEIEEEHLRGEIVRLEELHKGTIKRLTEINMSREAGGFDARALSRPGPGGKVAPSAFQILTAGLMLGMFAGIGLAYLADVCDKSFRTPDEVRKRLGLPLVGHIPFLKPDPEAARRVEAGEVIPDPLLVTHYGSRSVEAEAYRAVRTALYFSTQGEGHKVIQVTSPNKGDGKSLLIANLAISIAQSGKRVILIDADCRRPRQHKIFGLRAETGLARVIDGADTVEAAVQATAVANLSLLPCGPIPSNPAELLTSPRFPELLEAMRAAYDFVLVDTPPLLAVTDPCAVAPRVDGVLLTLRLSRQGRPHAERAREILTALGVTILGVVVNGVTRQGGGIYSSENYDYSESYGEAVDEEDDAYYAEDTRADRPDGGEPPAPAKPVGDAVKVASEAPRPARPGRGLLSWFFGWWV